MPFNIFNFGKGGNKPMKGRKKKPKKRVKPIGFGEKLGGGTKSAAEKRKEEQDKIIKDIFGD